MFQSKHTNYWGSSRENPLLWPCYGWQHTQHTWAWDIIEEFRMSAVLNQHSSMILLTKNMVIKTFMYIYIYGNIYIYMHKCVYVYIWNLYWAMQNWLKQYCTYLPNHFVYIFKYVFLYLSMHRHKILINIKLYYHY